jgi:hypothetical protein
VQHTIFYGFPLDELQKHRSTPCATPWSTNSLHHSLHNDGTHAAISTISTMISIGFSRRILLPASSRRLNGRVSVKLLLERSETRRVGARSALEPKAALLAWQPCPSSFCHLTISSSYQHHAGRMLQGKMLTDLHLDSSPRVLTGKVNRASITGAIGHVAIRTMRMLWSKLPFRTVSPEYCRLRDTDAHSSVSGC